MELEPYVTNFKLDQFVGGDEDYVKHVIQSFVDSAKVLKNSEPLNASKVDRYQVFLCYQNIQLHRLTSSQELRASNIF